MIFNLKRNCGKASVENLGRGFSTGLDLKA